MVGSELQHEDHGDHSFWFAHEPPRTLKAGPTVLLQIYDEYVMGYRESRYVMDATGAARSPSPDKPSFAGVVVIDAQVHGSWRATVKKNSVIVDVATNRSFESSQLDGLQAAADRYGRFMGSDSALVNLVEGD